MAGPLAGVKILDLSWILSGPFATMILSDLGAEVIKVERPVSGDLARGNGPFIDGISAYFLSLNRGKKSITIDLQTKPGKKLFLELARNADVIVENFVPGTMKRLGLDYNNVKKKNPAIIYASISGFGQTGPMAQTRALDIVVQAMGGLMSLTGEPDGEPMKTGVSIGDITAGLFAVTGIVSALFERENSRQGQYIDISMLDCQVAILENAFARYFATGKIPERTGNRHTTYTPFQAFQTKDGHIVVALVGGTRNQWPLFCALIGHSELIDEERYRTGESRTEHYSELEPVLRRAMKKKTTAQWLEEFSGVGIACGTINNIAQVAGHPQVLARKMITRVNHPTLGEVKVVNSPIKLSRTPARVRETSPALGQHTDRILKDVLKMSKTEIKMLREEGAI